MLKQCGLDEPLLLMYIIKENLHIQQSFILKLFAF